MFDQGVAYRELDGGQAILEPFHRLDLLFERKVEVRTALQGPGGKVNRAGQPLSDPMVHAQEFDDDAFDAVSIKDLRINEAWDVGRKSHLNVNTGLLERSDSIKALARQRTVLVFERRLVVRIGDGNLNVSELRVQKPEVLVGRDQVRFRHDQVADTGSVQQGDGCTRDAVLGLNRLQAIRHAAQANNAAGLDVLDATADLFDVGNGRLFGVPETAEVEKAARVAVGAIVLAASTVRIQTRRVGTHRVGTGMDGLVERLKFLGHVAFSIKKGPPMRPPSHDAADAADPIYLGLIYLCYSICFSIWYRRVVLGSSIRRFGRIVLPVLNDGAALLGQCIPPRPVVAVTVKAPWLQVPGTDEFFDGGPGLLDGEILELPREVSLRGVHSEGALLLVLPGLAVVFDPVRDIFKNNGCVNADVGSDIDIKVVFHACRPFLLLNFERVSFILKES